MGSYLHLGHLYFEYNKSWMKTQVFGLKEGNAQQLTKKPLFSEERLFKNKFRQILRANKN